MFRLPEGWRRVGRLDDFVLAAGIRIHRSGIAARGPSGEEVFGAAADRVRAATDRAWYELAERICVQQASSARRRRRPLFTADGERAGAIDDAFPRSPSPLRWVRSRSNGVALHSDWASACRRAHWELAERDRVLRSWMGEIAPRPFALRPATGSARRYEWIGCAFPTDDESFSSDLEVVGVFAFPRKAGLPMAMGFAARPSASLAVASATSEALQQLAFLWGASDADDDDEASDESTPIGPDLHLETYQAREGRGRLRTWLDGGHRPYARPRSRVRRASPVRFVDLTGEWLRGKARVAKAVCRDAVQLDFGLSPKLRHLPAELRLHPIA